MNLFGIKAIHRSASSLLVGLALLPATMLVVSAPAYADVWAAAARHSGVPVSILHGIALTESGKRWSDGSFRPWPWTLNSPVKGSQFFESRDAAAQALRDLRAAGVTNIDIGLMQINCGYHCSRVTSAEQLLDPQVNIRVASEILAEVRTVKGDLAATVGAYHAGLSPDRAVRSKWYQDAVAMRVRRLRSSSNS